MLGLLLVELEGWFEVMPGNSESGKHTMRISHFKYAKPAGGTSLILAR